MSVQQEKIGLLRKIAAVVCAVLCVDLVFAACSSQDESLDLIQAEAAEETAEESAAGEVSSGDAQETAGSAAEEADASGDAAGGEAQVQSVGEESLIYVYVCGAVTEPGVYALPEGTRVYEAVAAAGGFTSDADETYVNQALILSDQDRLTIPTVEETQAIGAAAGEDADAAVSAASYSYYGISTAEEKAGITSAQDSTSSATESESGLVNLNTASQSELETLPGIGSAKAQAIIAYREENGAFSSIEEIQNVSGIGEAVYAGLKDLITVE